GEASAALNDTIAAGIPTVTNLSTAAELPAGVVAYLDTTDPATLVGRLASTLDELLGDPSRCIAISEAAQQHAASWRFDDLAARVLEIVADTPRAQFD